MTKQFVRPATPKPSSKTASLGRPKDPAKGSAILDAAKRMFMLHGFERVSMDQIATEAGVSKLTVYSHFGDKEALFVAAIRAYCEQRLPTELFDPSPEIPLRERLLDIGQAFFQMISSPEAVAGHRVLCAPQITDSNLSAIAWEAGPQRVQDALVGLLERRIVARELDIADVAVAAAQYFTLLKGDLHARLVMGCTNCSLAAADAHVASAVDMFLRAYAMRTPHDSAA